MVEDRKARSGALARSYSRIQESRHRSVYPWTIRELRKANAASLLDFGGGDGRLLSLVCGDVPYCYYYDHDAAMVKIARSRLRSKVIFARSLSDLRECSFNAILLCAVWMEFENQEQCIMNLSWMASHLAENGAIFFAVTHPCFRDREFSSFDTNFQMKHYQERGVSFQSVVKDFEQEVILKDYHWPLQAMFEQAAAAGLFFDDLIELPDLNDQSQPAPGPTPWLVGTLRRRAHSRLLHVTSGATDGAA